MQPCTYRILDFAKSERDKGQSIAVIVRFDDLRKRFLRQYHLRGWTEALDEAFLYDISTVKTMLHTFGKYANKSFKDSEEVLFITANLSVGPLRTGAVGTSVLPVLQQIHGELMNDMVSQQCSPASFAALVETLVENTLADSNMDGLSVLPESGPA